jgi:hypothetical protein
LGFEYSAGTDYLLFSFGMINIQETNLLQIKDNSGKITSGCWNPYFQDNVTLTMGDCIVGFDIRAKYGFD